MTEDEDASESRLIEHFEKQERLREARHQENIQILVAISMFAGYITAFFNDLFPITILNWAATVFAGIVVVFLMYKLIVNSSTPFNDILVSDKLENIFSSLFVLSVIGFVLFVIIIWATEQFELSLTEISPSIVIGIFMTSTIGSLALLSYYVGKKTKESLNNQEEKLREELPEVLKLVEEEGLIDNSKRQALEERFFALLEKDNARAPRWYELAGGLFATDNQSNILRLSKWHRSRLINDLERIRRKAKYGTVERSDWKDIERIIEYGEKNI